MGIAVLVFFFAIFIGVLFLGGLMWFIFRRARNRGQTPRQFAGSSNYGGGAAHSSFIDRDDDSDALYANYSSSDNQNLENRTADAVARDSSIQSETTEPHAVRHEYVETSYTESSYSNYDSGSSSDSGSSDSGGSSSD